MITICVCESQPILIEGLKAVLDTSKAFRLVGAATNPLEAISLVTEHTPAVCLLDSNFGDAALQLVEEIKRRSPETKPVLWVDDIVGVESFRTLKAGGRGILKKTLPAATILECLWAVGHGNIWIENSISRQFVGFLSKSSDRYLTEREQEILQLIMRSKTNREIAVTLCISVSTVKLHVLHMFEKAGVRSRLQLALYGLRWRGVLPSAGEDDPPLAPAGSEMTRKPVSWRDAAALATLAWPIAAAPASLQSGSSA
ncbi:MAG TPA: response regulator transcription factor [Terriglobales bacterium]|nr:response regulator transcription factor [Terriglobales bacterium]